MALKILAAVDGGDLTERITTYALRIGKNAALHFLCAVDPAQLMSDSVALVFGEENRRSAAIEAAQKIVDRCVAGSRCRRCGRGTCCRRAAGRCDLARRNPNPG